MNTKERILLKADELFMQYGIRSVSMDNIANSLGMSKKTLYRYYADKEELVHFVVKRHIIKIQYNCTNCRNEAKDAVHELVNTMEHILEEFSNMNPMVLHDLEKFHFKSYRYFKEHKDKFLLKVIRDNIVWGVEEKLYRPDLDVEVIARYRLESMMIPFEVTVYPPGKYELAETSGIIMEHFIYGLATIKGHKLIQKYNEKRKKNSTNNEGKN